MNHIVKFNRLTSTKPRVSVLMTVFNAQKFIKESVESIIFQTFPDWELIIVDDGSTDASASIISHYSDNRIRFFPLEKNIGRTSALIFALNQAVGQYIAVLDADDVSDPNRLFEQASYLDNHLDIALVASWAYYVDEYGTVINELAPPTVKSHLYDSLGWTNPIAHSSAMYRLDAAKEVGGYPKNLIWAQDFGLILNLASRFGIAMIGKHLCKIRILTNSMTRSKKNRLIVAMEEKQLFTLAANNLNLSKKSLKLNQYANSASDIKLGICELDISLVNGLRMIFTTIFKSPLVLLNNAFVRKRIFKSRY